MGPKQQQEKPQQQQQQQKGGKSSSAASSSSPAAASSSSSTTTAPSQNNAPPTGKVEVLVPTIQQLLNLKVDSIRDTAALNALKQLQSIRAEQNKTRDEIRNLIDKQRSAAAPVAAAAAAAAAANNGRGKELDAIDNEFRQLTTEKQALNREMDLLRLEQSTFQRDSDRVKLIDSDFDVALREAKPAREKLTDLQARLADTKKAIQESRNAEHGGHSSASAVEEELSKIASQIEQATQRNDQKLVAVLGKTQSTLMKAKREFQKALDLSDALDSIEKQFARQTKIVDEVNKKVFSIDTERNTLRETVKSAKSFGNEFDKIRDKLTKVNTKLDTNRERKRQLSKKAEEDKKDPAYEQRSKEIDGKRKTQDELNEKLDKMKDAVTFKRIEYDPELRGSLVGNKGMTINQFQEDFGVYVDYEPSGWAVIVGGADDVEQALDGIKQMCSTLRNSRQQEVVNFDPLQAPQIIGQGGTNIRRFETLSGATIKVDSAGGTATIKGTPENIATAKKLFDEHFKNNTEVGIPFHRELLETVMGRGGATVRKIEQDSNCRRIKVDKDNFVIYCYGNQEQAENAKAAYTKLIAEMSTPPFHMKVDERQIRTVIGKAGGTINEIQRSSGAKLDVQNPRPGQKLGNLVIRGPKEAIEAARQQVQDLLVRDEIKVTVPSSLFGLLVDSSAAAAARSRSPKKTVDNKDDNEEKEEETGSSLCVLESIKQSSGADQVSLIRSESAVVIRGKRDPVNAARHALERFLIENRPESVRLNFCPAVFGALTAKNKSGVSKIDSIMEEVKKTGVEGKFLNAEISRNNGTIEVVGLDKNQVQAAASEVKKILEELNKTTSSMIVNGNAVPAIVGSGGSTIRDLQSRFKADININREKNEVSVYCESEDDLKACVEAIEKLAKN